MFTYNKGLDCCCARVVCPSFLSGVLVPLQEAISVCKPSMAQPHPTFLTPPAAVHSFPLVGADNTAATFVPVVSIYFDGEMTERDGVKSGTTSSRSTPTTVVSNE